jgi:RimJ/RimL family protein N-acetyltransferase
LPPKNAAEGDMQKYRFCYVVHKLDLDESVGENDEAKKDSEKTRVIGLLSAHPEQIFTLPESLTVPDGPETGILKLEIGYSFLPTAWGGGYATEALTATLDSLKNATTFWAPFNKVYIQAVVSPNNPGSIRVLDKAGLKKVGVYEWEGERTFIGGALQENIVLVHGTWLIK